MNFLEIISRGLRKKANFIYIKVPREAASAHEEATLKCPETLVKTVGEGGHNYTTGFQ